MLYHHFKTIASHPECRPLLKNWVCIGDRAIDGLPVLLFQKGSCYTEVVLNFMGTQVIGTREFTDMDELEPYLDTISLPHLPGVYFK